MRVLDTIGRVLWGLAVVGALLGGANFTLTYLTEVAFRTNPDISAPQMAALAAETIVPAVVPYVLARSWAGLTRRA